MQRPQNVVAKIQACAADGIGTGSYSSYRRAMAKLATQTIGKYQELVASGAWPPSTIRPQTWAGGRRLHRLEEIVIFKVTVEECAARARTPVELGFEFWKHGLAKVH
jgi:hypothetical protein